MFPLQDRAHDRNNVNFKPLTGMHKENLLRIITRSRLLFCPNYLGYLHVPATEEQLATKAAICPHASHTIKWLQPQPHRVCAYIRRFVSSQSTMAAIPAVHFQVMQTINFNSYRSPDAVIQNVYIHLPKIYSCLNKLLFQPYYKTRPKTYALKNVQYVILLQLTI